MNRSCLIASLLVFGSLAHADVFSYSQNNPPLQHCMQDKKAKEYPFLFNIDFVISKITASPANAFYKKTATVDGFSQKTYDFHDKEKIGFRAGVGAGLKNRFNLSLQYTHFRGGNHHNLEFNETTAADVANFRDLQNLYQFTIPAVDKFTIAPYSKQKMRLQAIDLLLQTAYWMNTKLRFQPFGGIRYQYFRRNLNTNTFLFEKVGAAQKKHLQNLFTSAQFRIRQLGVLAGTDVKYVFTRRFFIFSNLTVGLFSGTHKRNYLGRWQEFGTSPDYQKNIGALDEKIRKLHGEKMGNGTTEKRINEIEKELEIEEKVLSELKADVVTDQKSTSRRESISTHFQPLVQVQFGFGFNDLINDWFLISFRIAYEVSAQFDPNAMPISPQGSMNTAYPLRFNDSIQTGAILIGFTFGF